MEYNKYIQEMYGKDSMHDIPWKKASDQLFTPDMALHSWTNALKEHQIPPSDRDLTVLFPSANTGSHEQRIYDWEKQQRQGKTTVIVSDILAPEIPTQIDNDNNARLFTIRADARALPLQDGSIDIIFDQKGALWHAVNIVLHNKSLEMLDAVFREYYRVLNRRGAVIIDAIEGVTEPPDDISIYSDPVNAVIRNARSEGNVQLESSTYTMMERFFLSSKINRTYSEGFSLHTIGEGTDRLAVLRKKRVR